MEVSPVIDGLKVQFSGQLVLYVDDLAQVLGKSPKAISNLIARKALPFKIKTVGGQRCVDIYQVAQWLASDADIVQEAVGGPVAPPAPTTPRKNPSGQRKTKLSSSAVGIAGEQQLGGMAQQILKMRHDFAAPMSRFVQGLSDLEEFAFMQDVVERICFSANALAQSYVVQISKLAPIGSARPGEEHKKFFASEPEASAYLLPRLKNFAFPRNNSKQKFVVHLRLLRSNETLFHAVCAGGEVTGQGCGVAAQRLTRN
jgi:hypothetical protein